jgi:uncharacterized protein YfbU (UPF0304 family)
MKFTSEQKLIALMLAEVHQKLGIEEGLNSRLISDAIYSGNEWAIQWEYGSVIDLEHTPDPPHVRHVVDVLDMWSFIERAYEGLDDDEKKRFAESYPYGPPKFPGFDGNNESAHLSAARFLVEKMDRFTSFAGRGDLNSHSQTIDISNRMLEVFEPLRKTIGFQKNNLSVDDLVEIFKARVHPSRRTVA